MAFIYNKEWGLQYYGEIKDIDTEDVVSFVYDGSLVYFYSMNVFIVCPD